MYPIAVNSPSDPQPLIKESDDLSIRMITLGFYILLAKLAVPNILKMLPCERVMLRLSLFPAAILYDLVLMNLAYML